ncbi:MAG: NMD3-related protein [Methanomassiliicoccales archaeon]
MFCVNCGREGPLYENLCASCFLEKTQFTKIPDHVDLVQCTLCDDFLLDRSWRAYGSIEEAASELAVQSISIRRGALLSDSSVKIVQKDERNYGLEIEAEVRMGNLEKRERLSTVVRIKKGLCQRCSRIKGSYYESIIQVRTREREFPKEEMEAMLSEIETLVEKASNRSRDAFISKVEEEQGGFDVYLSSSSLGKAVSREISRIYGAEFKESPKTVGRKDGRDVRRLTYLVRLPSYRAGDVIRHKGVLYCVQGISPQGVRLARLETHESVVLSGSELESARVLARKEDIEDAVVLREEEKELEILDPWSLKPVVIKKPSGYRRREKTARILVLDDQIYLVPRNRGAGGLGKSNASDE